MNLTYLPLNRRTLNQLKDVLIEYYRTPDETDERLEGFVQTLCSLIRTGKILGNIVQNENQTIGFVLYAADRRDSDFSELPATGQSSLCVWKNHCGAMAWVHRSSTMWKMNCTAVSQAFMSALSVPLNLSGNLVVIKNPGRLPPMGNHCF